MKKLLSGILAVVMLAGCASESAATTTVETEEGIFTAGTYEASVAGRNGEVKVTATLSANEIESVEAEHEETAGIGDVAINQLIQETVDGQGIPSDTVSGATISSTAYLDALKDIINQAGGNVDELTLEAAVAEETEYVTEADVIVVGAGGAGLTAAITASQNGASVILLEKSSNVGGNTLATSAGINAADSKAQLEDEKYQEVGASVDGLINVQSQNDNAQANLVQAYAENSGEVIDWISDMGVEFEVEISEDSRNAVQNYYMLKATQDGSTAATIVNALRGALAETDIVLYTDMDATTLVTEGDAVTGVIATDANGDEITFTGKKILLATGGFGQNQELVGQVNPRLAKAITDEIAPTTGEGLIMAQAVGAKTVDLGEIQTFPSVIEGYGMFMSFGLWGSGDAIVVSADGERLGKEQFEMVDEVLGTDSGLAYGIFDEDNYSDRYDGLIESGKMVKADSLEELAEKLGINEEALVQTVETWNNDAETTGTDSVYGREEITTIEGTYYGYEYGVGAHYFMGGILINENTQVLNENDEPIEGLYAAGEVTGGFHGTQRVDGSGIGDAIVFGRIAGNAVAE